MTNENAISFDVDAETASLWLTEHAISAGFRPYVGFQHSVTVQIGENERAWNPDGPYFKGPDTITYIKNTTTGVVRARVAAELFE
ncbi:hypothetical protein [Terracoccus sp. 273MFTsu3.1]|uniref:hypothetical protein n=1 Tax=Terracoccus sp. 273MFTsu3.1 TaxID=1172188 RepID=UPI0012DF6F6B|nr:hypothetical protein [Terracoccus sp. 273MFTsu3.1]